MNDVPMFDVPPPPPGELESALLVTLAAWEAAGHLSGDTWAADRAALRDFARAVDLARQDAYGGTREPARISTTVKAFREAVEAYRARMEGEQNDGIDSLIAAISGPAIRHPA
jgi:hypothetical protein